MRALRLITTGVKLAGKSEVLHWKLTQAGDDYLISLSAMPSASKVAN